MCQHHISCCPSPHRVSAAAPPPGEGDTIIVACGIKVKVNRSI